MSAFNEASDYDNFFDTKLMPLLEQLKSESQTANAWGISIIISGIAGFASFFAVQADHLKYSGGTLITFFIILLIISVYQYARYTDRFTDDFKSTLIKEIICHVQPDVLYKPDNSISQTEYVTSSLIRYRYAYFEGSDYIEGNFNNVSFHCSQVHTQTDDGGARSIEQPTIFKGLFLVAKINSRFSGCSYAWDYNAIQLGASIMDEAYRLLPMPDVMNVHLNDLQFDKRFQVCSTDPYEATEILQTISTSKILSLLEQIQRPFNFSFVLGNCYVAIPFEDDIFGPTVNVPGDKEETKLYFNSVNLIFKIIEQLELDKLQ